MHLMKIKVPHFRVLKDTEVEFEREYFPRIYPLCSMNGGGKSTLLHLVFTLLRYNTNGTKKDRLFQENNLLRLIGDEEFSTCVELDIYDDEDDCIITLQYEIENAEYGINVSCTGDRIFLERLLNKVFLAIPVADYLRFESLHSDTTDVFCHDYLLDNFRKDFFKKMDRNTDSQFSSGELKRRILQTWLELRVGNNKSIVLIDAIESGLHPDWQYQIVRDIQDWSPDNQYIIATHSFDLCEALAPSHVKVL